MPFYEKKTKGTYQLTVAEKGWDKLKQMLKELTRKTSPITLLERIRKIKEVQRGWITYFRGTNIYGRLRELDGWLRNRLRLCIWKNWKKPERKRKNLIQLGVPPDQAYAWSRTRQGTWSAAADSKPNPNHHHHAKTTKAKRLRVNVGSLLET